MFNSSINNTVHNASAEFSKVFCVLKFLNCIEKTDNLHAFLF